MDNPANPNPPLDQKPGEVKIELPTDEPSSLPIPPSPGLLAKPEPEIPKPFSPQPLPEPPKPPEPPVSPGPTPAPQPPGPSSDKIISAAPPKSSSVKSVLIALVLLLTAASVGLGYYYFQKGGFDIRKRAEGCGGCAKYCGRIGDHCGSKNDCVCFRDEQSCDYCDWSCCFTQEPQPTSPPAGQCAGKTGSSVCEGVGDGDGSTSVLNCSGSTQTYTCQSNHTRFDNESSCKSASKTDKWTGYSTLVVEDGKRGTCSVGAGGNCDIGQADILPGGTLSQVCWDTKKDCSNCGGPTNTPTPTPFTVTLITSPSPTPTQPVTTCECTQIEISGASGTDEEGQPVWQVGDQIQITVHFSGGPEDVGVRILKNGVKLADQLQSVVGGTIGASSWSTSFTITEAGSYEIMAFVKKGGQWK
ncbi:MAG TPA: hypothetical protein VMW25_05075 [Clostridia bacterium]|nr:hypothetical protein [Clostridia bacterium]